MSQPVPDLQSVLDTLAEFTSAAQPPQTILSTTSTDSTHASRPTPQRSPAVDPATILEWPAALRCVTWTIGRNDMIIMRIRKMIDSQHEHERMWWKGREALLEQQKGRLEGQKELDKILNAVAGAQSAGINLDLSEENLSNELLVYDKKVLRASQDMVKTMADELQRLGIPFFGVPKKMIRQGEEETLNDGTKKIDEKELRDLQLKMIALLEDLVK